MREGEIVRDGGGRIMEWDIAIHIHDECSIVTVAELFKAAGHPVPEGAKLYRYSCEPESLPLDWIWQCSGKSAIFDDLKGEWGVVFNNPHFVADPDLSRLPALDAWYALPGVIKAVVK